ncbi:hypothetical protein [Paenibacillus sp. FSL H7-0326]|uniref:hypothetical protein n=1 Tax=Paenibacillus sp. FSL H7-0326 TaxID=1921144 RepID=UPI00117EC6F0|nr:hypothetical protein [Paenibacillus sp. FSL H7-0326]
MMRSNPTQERALEGPSSKSNGPPVGWSEAIPRRSVHLKDRARRAMVRLWDDAKQSHQHALEGPSSKSNGPPVGYSEAIPLTVRVGCKACSGQPDGLSRTNAVQAQQPSCK